MEPTNQVAQDEREWELNDEELTDEKLTARGCPLLPKPSYAD